MTLESVLNATLIKPEISLTQVLKPVLIVHLRNLTVKLVLWITILSNVKFVMQDTELMETIVRLVVLELLPLFVILVLMTILNVIKENAKLDTIRILMVDVRPVHLL